MFERLTPGFLVLTALASSAIVISTAYDAGARFVGPFEAVAMAESGTDPDFSRAPVPDYVVRKTDLVCADGAAPPPGCPR